MAHIARINNEGIVEQVIVVQEEYPMKDGRVLIPEEWAKERLGGEWKQCSYTGKIRKNYPGIGFTYDKTIDAFIPPKHFKSWILDEETANWKAPKEKSIDGKDYSWDEPNIDWVERRTQ